MLFFESTLGKYRRTREYEIKIETALNFPLEHEYLSQGNLQFLKSLHIEHMSNGEYLYQQEYKTSPVGRCLDLIKPCLIKT